jgi:HD-GYP domain-containing protein (c-di-GMP phosphodiesterase class II)
VVSALFHDSALTEYFLSERTGKAQEKNMRLHCRKGQEYINCIPMAILPENYVLYHHEYADGSGTFGLKEGEFPLEAGLISLADSVDVKYNLKNLKPDAVEHIRDYVRSQSGKKFSSEIADAFLAVFDRELAWQLNDETVDSALDQSVPHAYINLDDPTIIHIADLVAHIIDYKSEFTRMHTNQIAYRTYLMCKHYGYGGAELGKMYLAAGLHDLGKIKTPLAVLEKPGKLDKDEFEIIKKHVYYTWEWLHEVDGLDDVCNWASSHHEKLDGSGYPFGKTADELDFNSRMLAVIDIYQAVCEPRPYHDQRTHEDTMKILFKMADEGKIDMEIVKDIDIVMAPWSLKEIPAPDIPSLAKPIKCKKSVFV